MERLSAMSGLQVRFKLVTVFSEQQTEGDPLPNIAETLAGDVERYELFMNALRAVSPLPMYSRDEGTPPYQTSRLYTMTASGKLAELGETERLKAKSILRQVDEQSLH
jgi:hypothetical protein